MKANDFDFPLPGSLIALKPAVPRDSCRLLALKKDGNIEHRRFSDLPEYLEQGDLLLLNNTRVFPARLICTKKTGGKIEVLLVKQIDNGTWEILSQGKYTGHVSINSELSGDMTEGKLLRLKAKQRGVNLMDAVWNAGYMPLPPYIKRKADESDREHYQTVYAENTGSIAAPTAGLHFTEELLRRIEDQGVLIRYVTLHVGTGTFKPVKTVNLMEHVMDEEYFEMPVELLKEIETVKRSGKRIFSVGTTTTRAVEGFSSGKYKRIDTETRRHVDRGILESVITPGHRVADSPYSEKISGSTDIFIYPGYKFRVIDSLITNFHLPKSTPLFLTSAFCGTERLMSSYTTAVSMEYRFFSYGDAMLIL